MKTELYLKLVLKQYRPTIIIDYIRTAYRDEYSKVSITIDRNIKSTKDCTKFFGDFPAQENKKYILEIKYEEYIPEHIKSIMKSIQGKKITKAKFITQITKYNLS